MTPFRALIITFRHRLASGIDCSFVWLQSKVGTYREWLLLCMAHWQLGQREEAERWQDKAKKWVDKEGIANLIKRPASLSLDLSDQIEAFILHQEAAALARAKVSGAGR